MHAAVWSHSVARSKLRRCEPDSETPQSRAGKTVLGLGIALTLFGGLLIVLGITGYFVRGGHKYHLGYGVPDGILTLVTGVSGTRSVSRRKQLKIYAVLFATLTLLTVGSSVALIVLGSVVLSSRHNLLLLTSVIGIGEIVFASLSTVFSLLGLGVVIRTKFELIKPIPPPREATDSDTNVEPFVLNPEICSPDCGLTLVTDIRARI